jgi:hypothetical protein
MGLLPDDELTTAPSEDSALAVLPPWQTLTASQARSLFVSRPQGRWVPKKGTLWPELQWQPDLPSVGGCPRKPRLADAYDTLRRGVFPTVMDRCHGASEWALAVLAKVTGLDRGAFERRIEREHMRAGRGVLSSDWTPAWRPNAREAGEIDRQIEGLRRRRRALFARRMTADTFSKWPLSRSHARFPKK